MSTLSEASRPQGNTSNRIQIEQKLASKLAEEKLRIEADLIQEKERKIQKHKKRLCKSELNVNGFLMTKTVPNLCWLPKVPSKVDLDLIKEQQDRVINKYQNCLVDD